jgi:hypothetical protein
MAGMNLADRIDGYTESQVGGESVLAEIRRAIAEDPVAALAELGLTAGGDLYRKGGYVRAFCIEPVGDTL